MKKNEDTELAVERSEGTELAAEGEAISEDTAEVEEKERPEPAALDKYYISTSGSTNAWFLHIGQTHAYVRALRHMRASQGQDDGSRLGRSSVMQICLFRQAPSTRFAPSGPLVTMNVVTLVNLVF